MSIAVRWVDAEETAVSWQIDGEWAVHDHREAARLTLTMTDSTAAYHVLVDLTCAAFAPPSMLMALRNTQATVNPSYRGSIFFGANPSLAMLLTAAANLSVLRPYLHFVQTREDAWILHAERFGIHAYHGE